MNAPGCRSCNRGWRGYNTAGQLVACHACRPHVRDYLADVDRSTPSTLLHDPYVPAPLVPMPVWFRDQVRGLHVVKAVA